MAINEVHLVSSTFWSHFARSHWVVDGVGEVVHHAAEVVVAKWLEMPAILFLSCQRFEIKVSKGLAFCHLMAEFQTLHQGLLVLKF